MVEKDFADEVLKAFAGRRKTIEEIAAEVSRPDDEVEATVFGLVEDGTISREADFYFVTDEQGVSKTGLTDLEWKIVWNGKSFDSFGSKKEKRHESNRQFCLSQLTRSRPLFRAWKLWAS
jgi:hypothetical protein